MCIATAIVVFGFKSKDERPMFVTWQTIWLGLYCICFVFYFAGKYIGMDTEEKTHHYLANTLATVGNAFFLMHDWIFTEQYVAASLNMPVIIKIFSGGN